MSVARIDYDAIASTYDQRYAVNKLASVANALRSLALATRAERILEVGCGTGHWLVELSPVARWIHGLDISIEMLRKVKQREERFYLTRGQASQLHYKYFAGTYEADLRRFPSAAIVSNWMREAGFDGIESGVVERIVNHKAGREILEDPFLQKQSTSQLALLTDEAYAAGLSQIKAALADAEAKGERLMFPVDVSLFMITGRKFSNG